MTWSRRTGLQKTEEDAEEEDSEPEVVLEPTREVAPISRRELPETMTNKAVDPDSLKKDSPTSRDVTETETSCSKPRRLEELFRKTAIAMTDDQR